MTFWDPVATSKDVDKKQVWIPAFRTPITRQFPSYLCGLRFTIVTCRHLQCTACSHLGFSQALGSKNLCRELASESHQLEVGLTFAKTNWKTFPSKGRLPQGDVLCQIGMTGLLYARVGNDFFPTYYLHLDAALTGHRSTMPPSKRNMLENIPTMTLYC